MSSASTGSARTCGVLHSAACCLRPAMWRIGPARALRGDASECTNFFRNCPPQRRNPLLDSAFAEFPHLFLSPDPPMTSSGFDPVREPKRPRVPLMKLSLELERDWDYTLRAFEAYRELPPHKRYRALTKLFEKICPWIERGIQAAVLNHFILVQTDLYSCACNPGSNGLLAITRNAPLIRTPVVLRLMKSIREATRRSTS
jgi:hypothetical protein